MRRRKNDPTRTNLYTIPFTRLSLSLPLFVLSSPHCRLSPLSAFVRPPGRWLPWWHFRQVTPDLTDALVHSLTLRLRPNALFLFAGKKAGSGNYARYAALMTNRSCTLQSVGPLETTLLDIVPRWRKSLVYSTSFLQLCLLFHFPLCLATPPQFRSNIA